VLRLALEEDRARVIRGNCPEFFGIYSRRPGFLSAVQSLPPPVGGRGLNQMLASDESEGVAMTCQSIFTPEISITILLAYV